MIPQQLCDQWEWTLTPPLVGLNNAGKIIQNKVTQRCDWADGHSKSASWTVPQSSARVVCDSAPTARSVYPVLPPVVKVFAFPQLLQNPGPELDPVFIHDLLESQGQMEISRVAAQEWIVLLFLPDGGGTLRNEARVSEGNTL